VSCSGAQTKDFVAPQAVRGGSNPPQYDALAKDTQLVSVGIGGNDIGFSDIVRQCVSVSPFGTPCRDRFQGTLEPRIDALKATLTGVLQEVHARSPKARVLLVGYPQILPTAGPGCYPAVPFTPGDVEYLRGILTRLNGVVRSAASSGKASFVDTAAATVGHDVCTPPGTKWIEGLVPTAPAAPVHPNAAGAAALSRAVLATVSSTD
jgi:lysophospholipase L1-like esterase